MRRPSWMNPVGRWFGPKRIGWGFTPRTWEGWLVTLLAVAAAVAPGVIARGALSRPDPAVLSRLPPQR